MKLKHFFNQFSWWVVTIFLTWFYGKFIIWNAFDHFIPNYIENHYVKVSLYGGVPFGILSIFLSTIRDRSDFSKQIKPEKINSDSKKKLLELLVFVSRLIFVGYFINFWFEMGFERQFQEPSNLGFIKYYSIIIFGVGFLIISLFSCYLILLEPWRKLFIGKIIEQPILIQFLCRLLSIIFTSVLFALYIIPGLLTKVLVIFVCLCCLFISWLLRPNMRRMD